MAITSSPDRAPVGTLVTYEIEITNSGPSTTLFFVGADVNGLRITSAVRPGSSRCDIFPGEFVSTFRCLGTTALGTGESVTVNVEGIAANVREIVFNASARPLVGDSAEATEITTGTVATNYRFKITGDRQGFDACVELQIVVPATELLSVGTRVGYGPEIEFLGVQRGADLFISPAVLDDPATENVDESRREVAWEIVHSSHDSVNRSVDLVAFDLEGSSIPIQAFSGEVLELFCLQFRFIDLPPCEEAVSTDLVLLTEGTPDPTFFPQFNHYFTSTPSGAGQIEETEVRSLFSRAADFAADLFVRGDVDFDQVVDPQDALVAVAVLFDPEFQLDRNCPAALDANNDGFLNILDGITIIQTAFGSLNVQPAPPFPTPGKAVTEGIDKNSELPCIEGMGCEI